MGSLEFQKFLETPLQSGGQAKDYFSGKLNALTNMAVCGNPKSEDVCQYPALRYADGAQSDEMAAALTVANLQSQNPEGTRLRVILTDQNEPGDHEKMNMAQLFNWSVIGVRPGEPFRDLDGGWLRASPQVFEDTWPPAAGFQNIAGLGMFRNRTIQWASITTKTVQNPIFGTKAGTVVDVLMLFTPSTEDLLQSSLRLYTDLATACADGQVSDVLTDWLKRTA